MDYQIKKASVKKRKVINIEQWKLSEHTKAAIKHAQNAIMITQTDNDPIVKILIPQEHQHLITPTVYNRLLAYLRHFYEVILLLEIECPEQYEKERRQELLTQARREHRIKEKELAKNLKLSGKSIKDNSLSVG